VNALFRPGIAVCKFTINFQGYALDAGFIALLNINDFVFPAAAFEPPPVHAHKHQCPVAGLGSAGAGMDRKISIIAVKFTG